MSRMYDVKTGRRFDMDHKVWKSHMLNKDRSIKKRMDHKLASSLMSDGLVTLVPSVTEVAEAAAGRGAFKAGAKWGCEQAIETCLTIRATGEELRKDIAIGYATTNMNKPRDKGSELHETFDMMRTGQLPESAATEDQKKFYNDCCATLIQLGIDMADIETEVQFANEAYGGTCDLTTIEGRDPNVGIDWKTVSKERDVRMSELFQMAAYAKHFGWDEAHLCYWDQGKRRMLKPKTLGAGELDDLYGGFLIALDLFHKLNELAPIAK